MNCGGAGMNPVAIFVKDIVSKIYKSVKKNIFLSPLVFWFLNMSKYLESVMKSILSSPMHAASRTPVLLPSFLLFLLFPLLEVQDDHSK